MKTKWVKAMIPIIVYHHIVPDENVDINNNFIISQSMFERQLKYLYDNKFKAISIGQLYDLLVNKKDLPSKSIMITFDDGYLSNYLFAYQILRSYNYKATIFLITSLVNEADQRYNEYKADYISWNQVGITKDVFEYASHTHSLHYTINNRSALCVQSAGVVDADIKASLKKPINKIAFAYPYGEFTNSVIDILRNNGIKLGLTTQNGFVTRNTNPFQINRSQIIQKTSLAAFSGIVGGPAPSTAQAPVLTPAPPPKPSNPNQVVIQITMNRLKYTVNGKPMMFDVPPYLDINASRSMVPMRFIAEAFGAAVSWDNSSKTQTITLNGKTFKLTHNVALPGGMGTPVLSQDRFYVPLRYVSQEFGAKVDWDDATQTNTIIYR